MFSIKSIFTISLLSATALSLPLFTQTRTDASITSANCKGRKYDSLNIFSAESRALQLLQEGQTVGQAFGFQFPRQWANPDNLTIATPGPWYEFPLLEDGTVYDASEDSGPERLIFTGDKQVAAVVTVVHPEGVEEGSYRLCSTA